MYYARGKFNVTIVRLAVSLFVSTETVTLTLIICSIDVNEMEVLKHELKRDDMNTKNSVEWKWFISVPILKSSN